jgi:hypothetical protein
MFWYGLYVIVWMTLGMFLNIADNKNRPAVRVASVIVSASIIGYVVLTLLK